MIALTSMLLVVASATTCVEVVRGQDSACEAAHTCHNEAAACRTLAIEAETKIEERRIRGRPRLDPSPSDVQPSRPTAAGGSSCITTSRNSSVETVGTGGVCVQTTGADQGAQTAASITLNPIALATLDDAKSFARTARLTDLTLVVPISTATKGTFPSFVGLRANVDVAGLANGARAYARIVDAYGQALAKAGALVDQLLAALQQPGGKTPACLQAIAVPDEAAIERECRVPVPTQAQQIAQARDEVRDHVAALRRETDNRHGGLHLEVDVPLKSVNELEMPLRLAGQAQGRIRGTSAGWNMGVAGALGAAYVKPEASTGVTSFTWQLLLTADAGIEQADVHMSAGFSGNVGKPLDEAQLGTLNGLTGHFIDLQVLVSVPLTSGTGVSATVSWPIRRDNDRHGPTFSISFDGAYLLARTGQKSGG